MCIRDRCLRLLAMCIPKLLQTVMDVDIIIEIQNIETGDMKHEFN